MIKDDETVLIYGYSTLLRELITELHQNKRVDLADPRESI